jgi:glycosyltransferase involved in cell wall biosynthesis
LRIAIVIDAFTEGNGGGVATVRLAQGLAKRGHVITIISPLSVQKERFFQVKGFCLPGMKESFKNMDFSLGMPDKAVLRKAFADVDLVQIQYPLWLANGAAKVAKAMKKTVIGAFHVQPQNLLGCMGKESRFIDFLIYKLYNFLLFNHVPFVHCPSRLAAELLLKNGYKGALRVVSNGIPVDYVPSERARPDWFGDKLVILNVGRHAIEKRQALLIEAVKRSKYADKIQLLLCGKGPEKNKLDVMGAELPVTPFTEYISQEEKLTYLNTADLFILASLVELESLACLEAIGCGLPCLVSDSPDSAASQFALDDRFIFKVDDADSLAGKINYWYENRVQLRALRGKVLAMAENYRFEKSLDKMEALYAEAIRANSQVKA